VFAIEDRVSQGFLFHSPVAIWEYLPHPPTKSS
jgi:hypothetical protein